jgi:hypothetical protein
MFWDACVHIYTVHQNLIHSTLRSMRPRHMLVPKTSAQSVLQTWLSQYWLTLSVYLFFLTVVLEVFNTSGWPASN